MGNHARRASAALCIWSSLPRHRCWLLHDAGRAFFLARLVIGQAAEGALEILPVLVFLSVRGL
jgi:hypothetical protein